MNFRVCAISGFVAATLAIGVHAETPKPLTRVTDYHGIKAPDAPLAARLPALIEAAAQGDGRAAGEIYAGLSKCRALRTEHETGAAVYCGEVPDATILQAGRYLAVAAALGDLDAQYVYALAGTHELLHGPDGHATRAQMSVYNAEAEDYLVNLAHQCNASAIQQLYLENRYGRRIMSADLPAAYAMLEAMASIDPTLVSADDRKSLEILMIPKDIDTSRAKGERFVDEYCR